MKFFYFVAISALRKDDKRLNISLYFNELLKRQRLCLNGASTFPNCKCIIII